MCLAHGDVSVAVRFTALGTRLPSRELALASKPLCAEEHIIGIERIVSYRPYVKGLDVLEFAWHTMQMRQRPLNGDYNARGSAVVSLFELNFRTLQRRQWGPSWLGRS
jgi:hypothetical protein